MLLWWCSRFGDGYMITVRTKSSSNVKEVVRFFNRNFPEAVLKVCYCISAPLSFIPASSQQQIWWMFPLRLITGAQFFSFLMTIKTLQADVSDEKLCTMSIMYLLYVYKWFQVCRIFPWETVIWLNVQWQSEVFIAHMQYQTHSLMRYSETILHIKPSVCRSVTTPRSSTSWNLSGSPWLRSSVRWSRWWRCWASRTILSVRPLWTMWVNVRHAACRTSPRKNGMNLTNLLFFCPGVCQLCQETKWQPGAAGGVTPWWRTVPPAAYSQPAEVSASQHGAQRSDERGAGGAGERWWWRTHQLWRGKSECTTPGF